MQLDVVTKTNTRFQSVQGLRAIAFLLIFLSHAFGRLGWWGAFGVSLFIVLSGYLEAKHHLNDDIEVKPFVREKVRKVYPLHIIMLILAIPLSLGILSGRYGVIKLLAQVFFNITMTQSWVPTSAIYYSLNAVSWYLTLVLFFALITPLVMKWLRKSSIRTEGIVVTALICLDFFVGCLSMRLPASHWIAYVCPVTRAFDFIIGGGTYVLIHSRIKRWMMPIGIILAITILGISINAEFSNEMFSTAFWIIPSALIVPTVTEKNLPTWEPLIRIGNISFELFLIHQLVIRYLNAILGHIGLVESLGKSFAVAVIAFVISVVAALIYRRIQNRFSERKLVNEGISK